MATSKEKPGWQTTEFYVSTLIMLLGALMASGVLESGSFWDKIVGLIMAGLAGMGYTASRAKVKASGA